MSGACLVFDFDGTILDTEEPVYRAWHELWAEHGHELELAEWQAIIGTDAGFDPWTELERRLGRSLDPALNQRRRERRDEIQAGFDVQPGVLAWLDEAERLGVPVGIASSSPVDWVVGHLTRMGLMERFACLVCCDDEVPPKPDPSSYRLACAELDADPRRSVAVEDSPHGVAAATAAGLWVAAVPHDLTRDLDFGAADVVLESLGSLALADALARSGGRTGGTIRPN